MQQYFRHAHLQKHKKFKEVRKKSKQQEQKDNTQLQHPSPVPTSSHLRVASRYKNQQQKTPGICDRECEGRHLQK